MIIYNHLLFSHSIIVDGVRSEIDVCVVDYYFFFYLVCFFCFGSSGCDHGDDDCCCGDVGDCFELAGGWEHG